MEFTHNLDEHSFQAFENGAVVGELHYRLAAEVADFDHTLVRPEHEGKGIASRLVQYALDQVRTDGNWRVKATCPYVVAWLARHPDYADLIVEAPDGV